MNALNSLLSHGIGERIGWMLVHSVWQAALIAVLLGVALKFLTRLSAQLRYAAACAAMFAMALLPAATGGLLSLPKRHVASPIGATSQPLSVATRAGTELRGAAIPAASAHVPSEPTNKRSWRDIVADRLESTLPCAVCAWVVGVLLFSLRHLLAWTRLQQFRRKQVRPADASLRDRLLTLARRLGIGRAVKLVESGLVQVPTVIGWLRPMILLPASVVTGLDSDQLEALLLHELAHIRRHDYLVNLAQTIVEILGFYHPAVWWVSRRIRVERENCCDDVAARALGDNLRYAKALASMEDIRADRAELAMAASGGSLLARIRRLVGQAPSEGNPSTWAPVIIIGLLLLVVAIPAGLAIAQQYAGPTNELERAVVKGFVENRDKFTCGVLAWTHANEQKIAIGDQSIPPDGLKYGGQYQMWWDGDKIATKYTAEGIHVSQTVPPETERTWRGRDGQYYWIGRTEGSNVYTGGLLARQPRWRSYENWLESVILWRSLASRDKSILNVERRKRMAVEWSQVHVDGDRLIRRVAKGSDPTDVSYGEYTIEDYDPAKGYGLVHEEWYTPNGIRRLNRTERLVEVVPGAWFPVEVIMEFCSIQDSSIIQRQQMTLDLARCRFNDKSALPRGIFEMTPRQEQDELGQILEGVHQKRATAQTADAVTQTQGPRTTVHDFITAVMNGEYEKAARHIDPKHPTDDLKESKEILAGQELSVIAVLADAQAALVITSAIRADHGRAGPLTFALVRSPDSPTGWLIDDIEVGKGVTS